MKLVAVPDVILPDGIVRRGELTGGGGEYACEPVLLAGVIPGFLSAPLPFSFAQPPEPSFRASLHLDALVGMSVCTNHVGIVSFGI